MAEETKPAEIKKPLGKPKKGPVEMAEFHYNQRRMHIVFFASSLLLIGSCIGMVLQDHYRPWKEYQRAFQQVELERAKIELKNAEAKLLGQDSDKKKLEAQLDEARQAQKQTKLPFGAEELAILTKELEGLQKETLGVSREIYDELSSVSKQIQGVFNKLENPDLIKKKYEEMRDSLSATHYKANMNVGFIEGEYTAVRGVYESAKYELGVTKKEGGNVRRGQAELDEAEKQFDEVVKKRHIRRRTFELIDKLLSDILAKIDYLEKPAKDLEKKLKALVKDREDAQRKVDTFSETISTAIRNFPGLDFFGPTLKIRQQWLTNIQEDINFAIVPKVDRCTTCHMGIDNPAYEAVTNERGKVVRGEKGEVHFKDLDVEKIFATKYKNAEDRAMYSRMFMAHPNLPMYALGSSPHPVEKIGCTVCHEGDGRETDFSLAVHKPVDEQQEKDWIRRYGYHRRGYAPSDKHTLWDYPMLTARNVYSSCRKCHSQQFELEDGGQYNEGMVLFERAGCYACHRVDTYPTLDKHLPKLANGEPDESKRMRRPGPPLHHMRDKVTKEWAYSWVLSPRSFRPTTRMPHFFGQSNARKIGEFGPELVESVQAAAIMEYLWNQSDSREYESAPQGDSTNGRKLVDQIGCRACHKFSEDEYDSEVLTNGKYSPYKEEFGPNLAGIADKAKPGWVYAWLQNPRHYMPSTRMPRLLNKTGEAEAKKEAADITAYLMTLKIDNAKRKEKKLKPWGESKPPTFQEPSEQQLVDRLVLEQLRGKMPEVDAVDLLAKMPAHERVLYLGQRMIMNNGCYSCHEIKPGPDLYQELVKTPGKKSTIIEWNALDGIGTELTGTQPWGSKFLDRLDFGKTKFDGKNYHGISFKDAFGNEYKSRLTGEAHVKVPETRHDFAVNKLLDPRVYDAGLLDSKQPDELLKMPNFNLTVPEAEAIATFIESMTFHEVRDLVRNVKKNLNEDETLLNRGKRLIRDYNCAACHILQLDRFEVEYKYREKDGKEVTRHEWVEGRAWDRQPDKEDTKQTLEDWKLPYNDAARVFSYSWTSDDHTLKMPDVLLNTENPNDAPVHKVYFDGRGGWFVVEPTKNELIKVRRRQSQAGGDVRAWIREYKTAHAGEYKIDVNKDGEFEGRYPPMLRTQGLKTQADWLFDFLKEPYHIRPSLMRPSMPDYNIRMPMFQFTDEEAWSLAKFFWARDHQPGIDVFPRTTKLPLDATHQGDITGRIVPFVKTSCGLCHYIDGQKPSAGEGKYNTAPDLAGVEKRINPRWLDAWLDHPSWIYPGTTMTEGFSDANRADRKFAVEYLMNFKKVKGQ